MLLARSEGSLPKFVWKHFKIVKIGGNGRPSVFIVPISLKEKQKWD
jgi:hypothetical protein